ncbi:ATP-binding protein [bacterium]|nr:ATP-binding protein [bacterium]
MIINILLGLIIIVVGVLSFRYHRKCSAQEQKLSNIIETVSEVNNIITSVRYGNLSARVENSPIYEMKNLSESVNRMIETLNDREQMIVEYQSELTNQNKFLSALFNSLSEGIIVLDEKNVILKVNARIKKWLKTDDIIGKNVLDYIKVPEEKDITELSSDEIFLKNNKNLYFKASTRQIESKEHDDKYMIVVTNYTNQKEIDSLKEDFVATLTHDLKVPIIAEANMLDFFLQEKFGTLNDKQKEALENMKSSNKELLELVQIVLETYRLKEDELELNLEPISVKKFLEEIREEMSYIAHKTNNNIRVFVDEDFEIKVDYLHFKRVLKNLVNNAISYGKSNTDIELRAELTENEVQITVKDYGKGISEEDIEKIFNRYYSASKKFRKIGTGLGLYLSKQIVEAHGGILEVESKENEYTKFYVKLKV